MVLVAGSTRGRWGQRGAGCGERTCHANGMCLRFRRAKKMARALQKFVPLRLRESKRVESARAIVSNAQKVREGSCVEAEQIRE